MVISKQDRPARNLVNLKLRFDEGLRQKIEFAAKKRETSMNSFVVEGLDRLLEIGDDVYNTNAISLWRDLCSAIRKVEQITGQDWRTDRRTFSAVASLIVSRLKDQQPSLADESTVFELQEKLSKLVNKTEGLIDLLCDCGAIVPLECYTYDPHSSAPVNQFGKLGLETLNPENVVIARLLEGVGYQLIINLDDPVSGWHLSNDCGLSAEAAKGIFGQLPRLANEMQVVRNKLVEALRADNEAEQQGKRIAIAIRKQASVPEVLAGE